MKTIVYMVKFYGDNACNLRLFEALWKAWKQLGHKVDMHQETRRHNLPPHHGCPQQKGSQNQPNGSPLHILSLMEAYHKDQKTLWLICLMDYVKNLYLLPHQFNLHNLRVVNRWRHFRSPVAGPVVEKLTN